jgi:2-polyprenyl-3-methyl-5-hydroxy-6-metoxy-1,4-benzoquinol methylase
MALSFSQDLNSKCILDFGCGGGVLFKYFGEKNCTIIGCENQYPQLSQSMAKVLGVRVALYSDISEIRDYQFDYIFALDVLEHVDNLSEVIDKFLAMSHAQTKIIVSGPTESILYRTGRHLIGYGNQGQFHERNVYDVERAFRNKGCKNDGVIKIKFPLTLFRVSAWYKG